MIVVTFLPSHLAALELQPAQSSLAEHVPPEYAQWLATVGPSFTALEGDTVLAAFGLAEEWEGRAQCWALLSPHIGRHLGVLTRRMRRWFDQQGYRRIEAQTPQDFIEGHRWLRLLGFEAEGPMRNYYPDGRTAIRYARCST